jgi:hypothetical protein
MLNSHVELHNYLKALEGPYAIVLPICKACVESGCHIIVRNSKQNDSVKQARLDAERGRELLRQEKATREDALRVVDVGVVDDEEEVQAVEEAEEAE